MSGLEKYRRIKQAKKEETGEAALREGFQPILIEREAEYVIDIKRRLSNVVRELENGGKHGKEAGSKKANSESITQSSNESETSHKEACCESNGKSQRRRSRRDFRSLLGYVNSGRKVLVPLAGYGRR